MQVSFQKINKIVQKKVQNKCFRSYGTLYAQNMRDYYKTST